jgi:DNA polymerase elongation subunit (family B)
MLYTNVVQLGNFIYYSYYDNDGNKFVKKEEYHPSFYIPSKEESEYKGDDGKNLKRIDCNLKQYREFMSDENRKPYFYGEIHPIYQFISEKFGNKTINPDDFKFISIFAIDIEVYTEDEFPDINEAENVITSISIKDFKRNKMYVLTTLDFDVSKANLEMDKSTIVYKKVKSEYELLQGIVYIFKNGKPDIITGWNVEMFDVPYLYNRIVKLLGEDSLKEISPYDQIKNSCKKEMYKTNVVIFKDALIQVLDYYSLYKKYSVEKREQNKLEFIANVELGIGKIRYEGDLNDLMKNNPQLFVEYNIWDSELIYLLDNKLKIINLALTIAYEAKVTYQDVFSPVKVWDVLLYNHLKKSKIQLLPIPSFEKTSYMGAFVFDPLKGVHKWIIVYDVNSLYPNIVIAANLGKTTVVENIPDELKTFQNSIDDNVEAILNDKYDFSLLKKYDLCYTPNGQFWKRDIQSSISSIMESLYNKRINYQKKLKTAKGNDKLALDLVQYALKILLNSGYGAFANEYFRYKDVRVAEGITVTGQTVIKYIAKYLKNKLPDISVVFGDTDSLGLSCDNYVKTLGNISDSEIIEKLIQFSNDKLNKVIEDAFKKLSEKLNFFKFPLKMKREYIADRGIYTAKKKYVVRKVVDGDKILDRSELKFVGLEVIQRSMPVIVKNRLKEFVSILLDNDIDKLVDNVNSFKTEFEKLPVEEIASLHSVSDVTKYKSENTIYKKGSPLNARCSLLYNKIVENKKMGRVNKFIHNNDKVKHIYLKLPNPIKENAIGFIEKMPEYFGLEKYVDYETQFDKVVLSPLNRLTEFYGLNIKNAINVKVKNINEYFN